jgi:hypothetical protein
MPAAAGGTKIPRGGAPSVRVLLAREVAAQNAGAWRALYSMFDPVAREICSYRAFRRSWYRDAVKAGVTGRKGHRLRYSRITIWTDETGDYAFAAYTVSIGPRSVDRVRVGEDSFIRRASRWYDRIEEGDYASDC